MHQNATVAQWYKDHGRHEVFARGKNVDLEDKSHNLVLNEVDLSRPNKPEMEGPKTAAEEMQMMRKLYNEMLLEKSGIKAEALVQIGGIKREKKKRRSFRQPLIFFYPLHSSLAPKVSTFAAS